MLLNYEMLVPRGISSGLSLMFAAYAAICIIRSKKASRGLEVVLLLELLGDLLADQAWLFGLPRVVVAEGGNVSVTAAFYLLIVWAWTYSIDLSFSSVAAIGRIRTLLVMMPGIEGALRNWNTVLCIINLIVQVLSGTGLTLCLVYTTPSAIDNEVMLSLEGIPLFCLSTSLIFFTISLAGGNVLLKTKMASLNTAVTHCKKASTRYMLKIIRTCVARLSFAIIVGVICIYSRMVGATIDITYMCALFALGRNIFGSIMISKEFHGFRRLRTLLTRKTQPASVPSMSIFTRTNLPRGVQNFNRW